MRPRQDRGNVIELAPGTQPDTPRVSRRLAGNHPGDRDGRVEHEGHYKRPCAISSAILNRRLTLSFLRSASASSSTAARSHSASFAGTILATTRPRLVITVALRPQLGLDERL